MRRALAAALLLLPGAAAADDADLLAGRTAGAPVDCIDARSLQAPVVLDARRIVYRQTRARVWVTTPEGRCGSLAPQRALIVMRTTPRLCRLDRFRVVSENHVPIGPICRFGAFVPHDLATH